MIRSIDEFLVRCKDHSLVIYGAGDLAEETVALCEDRGIIVECLCVSDGRETKPGFITDLSVVNLSNLQTQNEPFIFVTVINSAGIREAILNRGFTNFGFITEEFIDELRKWNTLDQVYEARILYITLKNQIDRYDTISDDRLRLFEQEYQDLYNRFDKVVFRRSGGHNIGALLLELYYHILYPENERYYYVYQIENYSDGTSIAYDSPNAEVIKRFKGRNFEAVNRETVSFWKYVITNHRKEIIGDPFFVHSKIVNEGFINKLHEGEFRNKGYNLYDFSEDDVSRGNKALINMGITGKFGCIFARDIGYNKSLDWTLDEHLMTMEEYRNSDITLMGDAVSLFTDNGYQSVRVGKAPEESSKVKGLIDYASQYHDDFMDIYVAANCSFYFGDHSGVLLFQAFHDVPIAITNYPLVTSYNDGTFPFVRERDLIIYHKFYDPEKGRLLNLSELLEIEDCSDEPYAYSGSVRVFEKYKEKGIIPVPNTEQEITDLAQELMERMNGTVVYTEDDDSLQQAYWDILTPYVQARPKVFWIEARVGKEFLRNNLWLTR